MLLTFLADILQVCDMVVYAKRRIGEPLSSDLLRSYDAPPSVLLHWTVAIWSDYCDVPVREVREHKSFELVHFVTAYTLRFDSLVDNQEGTSSFLNNPLSIKSHPELRALAT